MITAVLRLALVELANARFTKIGGEPLTEHASLREVERYTKAAEQGLLAHQAMSRLIKKRSQAWLTAEYQ